MCFKSDVGPIISETLDNDEAVIVSRASKILSTTMLSHKSNFNGVF